jgi:hypothetical protein
MRVERSRIESGPPPGRGTDEVGDQHMRMQLRIAGATGPMQESRADKPIAKHPLDPTGATPPDRRGPLQVAERLSDGLLMRREHRRADPSPRA